MVRLQRVTFLALHNYLGLTTELFNPVSAGGGGGDPSCRLGVSWWREVGYAGSHPRGLGK